MRTAPVEFTSGLVTQSAAASSAVSTSGVVFQASTGRGPRILLATTGQLPSTARLAMEVDDAGATVGLVSPRNHPARALNFLAEKLIYRASAPLHSLETAIRRLNPDLVIPCDERTIRDLHALWRETQDEAIRTLVEKSVGPADNFPIVTSRDALLGLARRNGVRVPPSAPLRNRADLTRWTDSHPAPFVLKADGSWAGFGVRIISDPRAAQQAFTQMTRPVSLRLGIREAVLEGNSFPFRSWLRRETPAMSVQGYVDGWPANIGVACWKGEVLAATCAESVATESATGPSTVARVINNAEMVASARTVVRALGISGLVGFDFMIEAATGHAYMIEMNARNTPICALRLGPGRDLAEALVSKIADRTPHERPPRTERDIIVFFPDTWRMDPSNQFLRDGYHDVPWEQPELVRRLMKPELRDRYWAMRALRRLWLKATAHEKARFTSS